ncbi:MAG: high-affinity nickel-transport family protein [Gemmatimonadetes bacterium]|nr:high-affinity nickel-transport family protein [Gemmatimonadota bacterium]
MLSGFSLLVLGFLLGLRHALDPDHVVAVAAIVARHPSVVTAARVGALWGLGHSATILAVGGVIAWFRVSVAEGVAQALEFGVALMLVAIGVTNLRTTEGHHASPARPALVGMMHGLAGSAAVALLVLATVSDARQALAYLAVFGLGTIVAMTAVTAAMAVPLRAASDRLSSARRGLLAVSGWASIAVGLWLAVTLAMDAGLLGRAAAP